MRMMIPMLLMLTIAAGCNPTPSSTAVDRLRPAAATHAAALSGTDMAAARRTGRTLLAQLAAYADWD